MLGYLVEAYGALETFAGREPPFAEEHVRRLEQAVADIQLFGSQGQVDRLYQVFQQKRSAGQSDLNVVINELRAELRQELGLSALQGNVTWLRIDPELVSPGKKNAT